MSTSNAVLLICPQERASDLDSNIILCVCVWFVWVVKKFCKFLLFAQSWVHINLICHNNELFCNYQKKIKHNHARPCIIYLSFLRCPRRTTLNHMHTQILEKALFMTDREVLRLPYPTKRECIASFLRIFTVAICIFSPLQVNLL